VYHKHWAIAAMEMKVCGEIFVDWAFYVV